MTDTTDTPPSGRVDHPAPLRGGPVVRVPHADEVEIVLVPERPDKEDG